ncbi:uncharacterized protein LOC115769440 [Drosophila novamexicana]|uniref:uncharacterized protein LOC115769440 n=1 Tax=Drosophila novamexicana TaxID=47314 RepID=UPI0011E597A7|nr:uncharacterized protein LOC115769440 [Drosophila novamexicana]
MSSRNLEKKSEKQRLKQLKKLTKAKQQQDKVKKHTKKLLKMKTRNISFDYQLFLYRQELRRANTDFSYLRLSRAKIMLTAELIAKNIGSYNKMCSVDDLKMLSREVQFKKRLCNQVERLEQFQELGLTDVVLNGKKTAL